MCCICPKQPRPHNYKLFLLATCPPVSKEHPSSVREKMPVNSKCTKGKGEPALSALTNVTKQQPPPRGNSGANEPKDRRPSGATDQAQSDKASAGRALSKLSRQRSDNGARSRRDRARRRGNRFPPHHGRRRRRCSLLLPPRRGGGGARSEDSRASHAAERDNQQRLLSFRRRYQTCRPI